MYLYKKENGKLVSEALRPTLFVPMTGAAEDRRQKKPDPLHPAIANGSFEDRAEVGEGPAGWHYVRQAKLVDDPKSPDGKQYLDFTNSDPGRGSQALQGFAVDGRKVSELDVSLRVRLKDVKPGQTVDQLPCTTSGEPSSGSAG
jgi:protein-L-isoaspartate(D-aspartate) O-methyltransferase